MILRRNDYECARCRCVFGTLESFDGHQQVSYGSPQPVTCLPPEAIGLVRDARGVWQTKGGLNARARKAAQMTAISRKKRAYPGKRGE